MKISLTSDRVQAASDLLYEHWQEGRRMAALPDAVRPRSRAEAYAVQARLEARSAHPLLGWKIAATSVAGQRHIGVEEPLAGRLLAERVVADGGSVPLGANHMRVAEVEFAFRMGRDLPPRTEPYRTDEVLAAVDTLHPAIEIPDSRYEDFVTVGAEQLIADNACAHLFVLGPPAPAEWRSIDLAQHRPRGAIAGRGEWEGLGANVLRDPLVALAWLANELSRIGETLRRGQVVATGTCLVPIAIAEGDAVSADFGNLGRVSVRFS